MWRMTRPGARLVTVLAGRPHDSRERCRSGAPQRSQGPDRIGSTVGDRRWFRGFCQSGTTFHRDVDIAVAAASDDAAESLVRRLLTRQYRLLASVEQDAVGRLATVRLGTTADPAANVVVDLLFASYGIEPEIAEGAEQIEILPGLVAPIARTAHLIAMKLLLPR